MQYRKLGKTGYNISEVSLGTWQVGGKWGSDFNHENAETIINAAIDKGINFIDTSDVYSDGLSEAAVAKVVKSRSEKIYIATKCGRQLDPHVSEAYTPDSIRKFVEASLKNMNMETLDLIQLHCPPTDVFYRPEIFEVFDQLKTEGKIKNLGVSVEKVEEALKAIEYPNVTTIQIVFNIFRQRPMELFFPEAKRKDVGIIARVPLASGLLTGKMSEESTFEKDDHRFFNRNGEMFDKGETFSGVDFSKGLAAVSELQAILPSDMSLPIMALKWILMNNEVSCIIPGASSEEQILSNIKASEAEALNYEIQQKIKTIYTSKIKQDVHQLW
jgi:aryl-alcohol dehydrogenase-like predicted oxidoreductase